MCPGADVDALLVVGVESTEEVRRFEDELTLIPLLLLELICLDSLSTILVTTNDATLLEKVLVD